MSENKKIKENKATEGDKKPRLAKKWWILIIVSIVSVVALATCGLVGVFNVDFNYEKKDISKYITVPEELYTSYNVNINIPEIKDFDVNEEIVKLLYSKRITPEGPIYSYKDVTIGAGDVVYMYFRGYTVEDGIKKYFDGGCNFDGSYAELGIGSGDFIPGFESGLIGKNPKDYASLIKRTGGTVNEDDMIAITYSVIREDNTSTTNQTVVIDLADTDLDQRWGEGFREFFIGKEINPNEIISNEDGAVSLEVSDGSVYFDIKIRSASKVDESEHERLILTTYFPYNYNAEDLKGKQAYFEAYVVGVDDYGSYEFDDSFVTDVLKVKAEDLTAYSGDTIADKYKSLIRETLETNRQNTINVLAEEAFWDQIKAGTEVKKFPKKEVEKMYDTLVSQLMQAYRSQGSNSVYANDFDAFARTTLELSSNADWKAYLRKDAEDAIKEKLIFYYILQVEELEPSDEEYDRTYDVIFTDHLQEYLDYYKITEETPNYEAEVEKGKKEVLSTYGEEYFEELVIYDYVMNEMVSRANIILTAE